MEEGRQWGRVLQSKRGALLSARLRERTVLSVRLMKKMTVNKPCTFSGGEHFLAREPLPGKVSRLNVGNYICFTEYTDCQQWKHRLQYIPYTKLNEHQIRIQNLYKYH